MGGHVPDTPGVLKHSSSPGGPAGQVNPTCPRAHSVQASFSVFFIPSPSLPALLYPALLGVKKANLGGTGSPSGWHQGTWSQLPKQLRCSEVLWVQISGLFLQNVTLWHEDDDRSTWSPTFLHDFWALGCLVISWAPYKSMGSILGTGEGWARGCS